jgi:hypothetical protein
MVPDRQDYETDVRTGPDGRVYVPVPFDPDRVWGAKPRHLIHGTVAGMDVRGTIESVGDQRGFVLGPAWRRDCGLGPGDTVTVSIKPEGPQRADLAPDVAAALDADPKAGEFFDGLAQFYRNAYLKWIDSTKRRPEQRPVRILEMIELLRAGQKQRPRL